ncbi:MAG: hypothetical protein Fur0032_20840 [Terrimicrobiaceae bacterium]
MIQAIIHFLRGNRSSTVWRIVLCALAAILGCHLCLGKKPWTIDLTGKHDVLNYWHIGSWNASAFGLLICLGLALLSPWWAGQRIECLDSRRTQPGPVFLWLVLLAMLFATFQAIPRLSQSLWDDEELNVRKSIVGRYQLRKDQEPRKFHELDWDDTFLEYREPNNHVLNTVLARASHELWKAVARPTGLPFTEWPMRVPAFVMGILAIASAAWMLAIFGMPRAGILAAWVAALHPWYLRYASEIRGYSFALFLVPVVFALWHGAVFRGSWAWWAALCVAQGAMVLSYPGTLFILVVLNLCALPVIFFQIGAAQPAFPQSGRWFACNSLTAGAVAFWLFPLLPQLKVYLANQSAQGFVMGWPWFQSVFGYFLLGTPWAKGSAADFFYPEIVARLDGRLWVFWVFLVLVAAGLLAGAIRLIKTGPIGFSVVAATAIPPWITYAYSVWSTQIIYESYVIYALPGFLVIFAAGLDSIIGWVGRENRNSQPSRTAPSPFPGRIVVWSLLLLFVCFFAWLTAPARSWLVSRPLQPIRESVLLTRPSLDPSHPSQPDILTASYCIPPFLYDPWMTRLDSPTELRDLMIQADATGRPLYLNIGMPWAAREYSPGMWAITKNPALFEAVAHLRGWDSGLDRLIFRYRPGSVSQHDLTESLKLNR